MGNFSSVTRAATWARGIDVYFQRSPPVTEEEAWNGNPCNGSSTQDFAALNACRARLNRRYFIWSPRRNDPTNANNRPNPTGAPLFRRSTALPWATNTDYYLGEKAASGGSTYQYNFAEATITSLTRGTTTTVGLNTGHGLVNGDAVKIYDAKGATWLNGLKWFVASVTATSAQLQATAGVNYDSSALAAWTSAGTLRFVSGASFAADAAKWTLLTTGIVHNECRTEYTTHLRARNAALARLAYALGAAQFDSGRGWGDYGSGQTVYGYSAAQASKDSIFTSRPQDVTQSGATNYAVAVDTILLTNEKITDGFRIWAPGMSAVRGDIFWSPVTKRFYWCNTSHTTAEVDLESDKPAFFNRIKVSVLFDHEVADNTPGTIADGTGSVEYLLSEARALCDPWGIEVILYTNDCSSRRPISGQNGVTEASIPKILTYAHCLLAVADGRNAEGSLLVGNVRELIRRFKYIGGDTVNGVRAEWAPGKISCGVEMSELGGQVVAPITSLSIGPGPSYTVTVNTTPIDGSDLNLNISSGEYVYVLGLRAVGLDGACKTASVNKALNQFALTHRRVGSDPVTGASIDAPIDGSKLLVDNHGAGVVMVGGNRLEDFVAAINILETDGGATQHEAWLAFADTEVYLPGEPVPQITAMTNTYPIEIETDIAHGLSVSTGAAGRATVVAARGLTNLNMAALNVGTVLSPTRVTLDGYDARDLDAWTSGGWLVRTRRFQVYERFGRLCLGWGA